MPSPGVLRNYQEDGYYHIFNRGIEKRPIFLDEQDYQIFLYYMHVYLLPLEKVLLKYPDLPLRLYSKNLNKKVALVAYCLMPNHFHLLLQQKEIDGASKFLKQLMNAYTAYFNKKYLRTGGLVQGRFKAVLIDSDEQLLHVSRYIHLNPLIANLVTDLVLYKWSSYPAYINERRGELCRTDIILADFSHGSSYQQFVADEVDYGRILNQIKHFALDQD